MNAWIHILCENEREEIWETQWQTSCVRWEFLMGSDSRPAGLVRLQRPESSLPHHHSASAKLYFIRFSWHPLRVCFLVPTILFPCCHSRPVFVFLRVWTQWLLSWCLIVLDRKAGLELGNLEKYDSWSVVSSSLLLFSHFISLSLIHPLQPPGQMMMWYLLIAHYRKKHQDDQGSDSAKTIICHIYLLYPIWY